MIARSRMQEKKHDTIMRNQDRVALKSPTLNGFYEKQQSTTTGQRRKLTSTRSGFGEFEVYEGYSSQSQLPSLDQKAEITSGQRWNTRLSKSLRSGLKDYEDERYQSPSSFSDLFRKRKIQISGYVTKKKQLKKRKEVDVEYPMHGEPLRSMKDSLNALHISNVKRIFPKNASKDEHVTLSICDLQITSSDILDMAEEANKTSSSTKCGLSFSDCHINVDHLKQLQKVLKATKIEALDVLYMENINELLGETLRIAKTYNTEKLSFEYDGLNDESIKLIAEILQKLKITSLKRLDISYNKDISKIGYELIGKIMLQYNIVSLKATGCRITDEKLTSFFTGLKNGKLEEIDISCNAHLTANGMEALAKYVVNNKCMQTLNLSGCEISQEMIKVFHKVLPKRSSESLVRKLDVSYNSSTDKSQSQKWFASLASVVGNYGVRKLSLAGCDLNGEHIRDFRNSLKNRKIDTINMADNASIRGSLTEIAQFVSQCQVKNLDLSDCWLSAYDLQHFLTNRTKLISLRLGDREREPDADYMKEVCRLLNNVYVLKLRFFSLNKKSRLLLVEKGQKLQCEIILTWGSDADCETEVLKSK